MGYQIPRIQYENLDTTATTVLNNGTITAIPSTVGLVVGMFVRGTGIPAGATIGSFTSTTVTLASGVLASANGTLVAIAFGFEILFDFPPVEDTGEALTTNSTTSYSLSGIQQTAVNYIEAVRTLNFSFVSESIKTQLDTFLTSWSLLGNSFRYYDDKTTTTFTLYKLKDIKSTPKKRAPKGLNIYVYDYPLNFRRAI